jgi:hypothetical protein
VVPALYRVLMRPLKLHRPVSFNRRPWNRRPIKPPLSERR